MSTAGLPRYTGDADPYPGGDPYADYRTPGPDGSLTADGMRRLVARHDELSG
ncbi:hypothetical protein [Streptomyces platensis]|uniref:hypothetical protein n=1 Tax=Streptomyces platensis TaxID=58346 RepID=UPI0037A69187